MKREDGFYWFRWQGGGDFGVVYVNGDRVQFHGHTRDGVALTECEAHGEFSQRLTPPTDLAALPPSRL